MALSRDPEARKRQLANRRNAPPPAKGNRSSLKTGAKSEVALAPIRAKHLSEIVKDYPHLDMRRAWIAADRLAHLELASEFVDQHGLFRNKRGEIYPIVPLLERWRARAEDILAAAEAESKRSGRLDLASALAGLPEAENDGDDH